MPDEGGPGPRSGPPSPAHLRELEAEATYTRERVALARRRMLLGRGDPSRLAELERLAEGAERRYRAARPPAT